jgi:hypothetical protein
MILWEAGGYVAENLWEAYLLWCEFTIAGLWWAIFITALISWVGTSIIFVNDESINN